MFKKKRHYFDWAASYGNPSSPHTEGRAARQVLEDARTKIARELQMKPDDIIFTSGATEANNIVISGITAKYAMDKGVSPHVLYLPSAHASTVKTIQALAAWGIASDPLPIKDSVVDIEAMKKLVRPETILVSMDFVCSETGTVWNTREVKHALPAEVYLHVDASQAPLAESVERARLGVDLLVLDGAKVGETRGAGVLAAPRTIPLTPLMYGGGQERGLRPGTENVAAIAAFAAALVKAREGREAFAARSTRMRATFIAQLSAIQNIEVNQGKHGVPHILNLSLIGRDTDYLVALLDEAGFAVSTKSACESDSDTGSRAVLALTGDSARAGATLRISWGPAARESDITRLASALIRAVDFLDQHAH
ncbi:MAG TPA: aminotransferase class V-fold PLP-dependent enzyme [Candidatus Paceibacterota bacterium]|nr:aminotransferase class V-fold PLP-dependent enzyme [Candidatus Paceibacterota bacterium]